MLIQLICQAPQRGQELEQIAARWQLQASVDSPFALV
ncbi:16S rRNA methyltransferase, partial [Vibrio cholerae]